jgi:hypothetical protein
MVVTPESELTRRALQRIRAGLLPPQEPARVWAGHGRGEVCALCDSTISSKDLQYEFELELGGSPCGFQFHIRCAQLYQGATVTGRT